MKREGRFRFRPNGWAIAAGLIPAALAAQQLPDAGRLLEETRPALTLPQHPPAKIEIQEQPSANEDRTQIHVSHFHITGASRFSEAELHALVAPSEGSDLTLGELRRIADQITEYYRAHGYLLARAYLPAQDVKNGEVEIAVLEGRLGQVTIDNSAGLRGAALAPLSRLQPGDPVHDGTLERSLLQLSDLPGVDVHATLKPGTVLGASDVLVDVAPGPRVAGSVDADNYGDRFSGQYRLGGTLAFNNPLALGDQAVLRAVAGRGMNYARASWQLPVNSWGTRIGASASDLHYRLDGALSPLRASGEAQTGSLYLLHPFVRSRLFNLNGQLQYDHLKLEDRIGATNTNVEKSANDWTVGVSGDFLDALGRGGANSFSLTHTTGRLHLDATSDALDAMTAQTTGSFGKWNASWLRMQQITDADSLYASLFTQWASKNLDSSQKFSLGGANAVRAYPQGEAPGDQGYLLTLEARHVLAMPSLTLWQLVVFVDGGRVDLNKQPWMAVDNRRTLTGAGLGLNIAQGRAWTARVSVAWRLTDKMPVSDSDRSPRIWGQIVKSL